MILLTKIDQDRELLVAENWNYILSAKNAGGILAASNYTDLFSQLIGRGISGLPYLQVQGFIDSGVTITFGDDKSRQTVKLPPGQISQTVFNAGPKVFYVRAGNPIQEIAQVGGQQISISGVVRASGPDGHQFQMSLAWNGSGYGPATASENREAAGFAPMSMQFMDLQAEKNGLAWAKLNSAVWQ
jgi:hypothetical protein